MQESAYNLGGIDDWAALILPRIYGPAPLGDDGEKARAPLRGFVFVYDQSFGDDALWKLPAGHRKNGESPLETAIRELAGETNLQPPAEAFRYVGKYLGRRKDHWKILFTADAEEHELAWMGSSHPENEGEVPKLFTRQEIDESVRQGRFMPEHYNKLVNFSLIIPAPNKVQHAQA